MGWYAYASKDILIKDLKEYENNPRNNENAVEAVAESIKQFGFKVPIVVDSNNIIVCGHTRIKAAKRLGLAAVPCVIADDLTPEQIKAFRLADNKTAELAEWDFTKLEQEIQELTALDIDVSGFGFDNFEIKDNYNIPKEEKGSLVEQFTIPPFSVLDTRQGYWKDKKRKWNNLICDNAEARKNATVIKGISKSMNFNNVSILDSVLAEIIIKWFMPKKGNKTFDCFAGDTVFGFVSAYLGNEFTGIELRKEQADFNNKRVNEYGLNANYICDDGRNVNKHLTVESQDLFFSCPPYFDLEHYSNLENDASNQINYENFYKILDTAFKNAIKCLKNNRFAVIVCGDVRNKKNGAYYDFISDIKMTFKKCGLCLYNELILVDNAGTAALRANKYMINRKMVKVHQNVLVFYKGNTNEIKNEFENIKINIEGQFNASEDV